MAHTELPINPNDLGIKNDKAEIKPPTDDGQIGEELAPPSTNKKPAFGRGIFGDDGRLLHPERHQEDLIVTRGEAEAADLLFEDALKTDTPLDEDFAISEAQYKYLEGKITQEPDNGEKLEKLRTLMVVQTSEENERVPAYTPPSPNKPSAVEAEKIPTIDLTEDRVIDNVRKFGPSSEEIQATRLYKLARENKKTTIPVSKKGYTYLLDRLNASSELTDEERKREMAILDRMKITNPQEKSLRELMATAEKRKQDAAEKKPKSREEIMTELKAKAEKAKTNSITRGQEIRAESQKIREEWEKNKQERMNKEAEDAKKSTQLKKRQFKVKEDSKPTLLQQRIDARDERQRIIGQYNEKLAARQEAAKAERMANQDTNYINGILEAAKKKKQEGPVTPLDRLRRHLPKWLGGK